MPKISDHTCQRCDKEKASYSIRIIGTGVILYLGKNCMAKPDIYEWINDPHTQNRAKDA